LETAVWLAVAPLSAWLWLWPQPAGTAAVILAAWGGVIAVLEFGAIRRALAIVMIVLLMVLELRSIYHDRDVAERARVAEQKSLSDEFSKVVKENQDSFAKTEAHFESVLEQLNDVAKDITGGDSFAYIVPQDHDAVEWCRGTPQSCVPAIPLTVNNGGEYALLSVSVTIVDLARFPKEAADAFYGGLPVVAGVIPPHGYQAMKGHPLVPDIQADGIAKYWIFLRAQNGEVTQLLKIRKGKNGYPWGHSYDVTKQVAIAGKPGVWTSKTLLSVGWTDEPQPSVTNPPTATPPSPAPPAPPPGR
jgi:uncharacterized coiled-coil protein SlyX